MKLSFALLAHAADADEQGTLVIRGGGLELLQAATFPATCEELVLIARFDMSPAECGYDHALRIPFLGPDGQELATLEGPLRGQRRLEEPYRATAVPILAPLPAFQLPEAGDYGFHLLVDGFELATLPLYVRHGTVRARQDADSQTSIPRLDEHGDR